VDLPGETADEINRLIESGKYRSVQDFLLAATSNQLHIERQQTLELVVGGGPGSVLTESILESQSGRLEYGLLAHDFGQVATIAPPTPTQVAAQLNGLWNRFFPVKITVRVLANILKGDGAYAPLDSLQERAADVARKLGREIIRKERDLHRKRGDMISTALPWKRDESKAKARFKTHFVGYLSKHGIEGAPATLRFVSIASQNGTSVVGLTAAGLHFAELLNSVIDKEDYSSSLSLTEREFLTTHIKVELPKESNLMRSTLRWIKDGATSPGTINDNLQQMIPHRNGAELVTIRSGLLSRMAELNLIMRTRKGLLVSYELTEDGVKSLKGD
jgi:hypothetical protein